MPELSSLPASSSKSKLVLAPVAITDRIETIDILRGFALFGVIVVNTWYYQRWALSWQIVYTEVWTGTADHIAMWLIEFFAYGRFWRLFAFLFGLGFALQLSRAEQRGAPSLTIFVRRLLVLLLFGILHVMLRGNGDILILYAVLGFVLLLFQKFSPRALLTAALIFIVTYWTADSVRKASYYDNLTAPQESASIMEARDRWDTTIRAEYEEIARVRREGSLLVNVSQNLRLWVWEFGETNPLNFFAYMKGEFSMFLLGLYAGRRRIFESIHVHLPLVRKLMWWGLGLGVTGISTHLALTRMLPETTPLPYFTERIASLCQVVGAPAFSLFYASAIILLVQRDSWRRLLAPLAFVGRMPLSNYLLHTVVHFAIFYGVGLGLYGKVPPTSVIGVSLIVYALMALWSAWWMNRFRFGPAEWIWRTLTYGKIQPMLLSGAKSGN